MLAALRLAVAGDLLCLLGVGCRPQSRAAAGARRQPAAAAAAADRAASRAPPTSSPLEEQRIADKYKHLEDVLLRMAELDAASDPRRAALLKKAVAQSKEQLIAVRFERLVELLGKDQLSRRWRTRRNSIRTSARCWNC